MSITKKHHPKPYPIAPPILSYFKRYNIITGVLILYLLSSMSMFYQVVGLTRCPKIKRHAGIKLKPIHKAKEPFSPGDVVLFICETTETTQTIRCLEDGRWNEVPTCPDPSGNSCPDLGSILHGSYNSTGPFKVGSTVVFKCDNELPFPNNINQNAPSLKMIKDDRSILGGGSQKLTTIAANIITNNTTTTTQANTNEVDAISATTLITPGPIFSSNGSEPNNLGLRSANLTSFGPENPVPLVRYNLTGYRVLQCLPSSKWNHPVPTCSPIIPESHSNWGLLLTSALLILIPILIFAAIAQIFIRWKKRQQQRERWKQYFTDYKYRHSKTSITFGMRAQNPNVITPVTDL